MSAASRLSIVLAGLLVVSGFFSSSPSPSAGNASSSKPDTSPTPSHEDSGLNAAMVIATQTGPNSELPRRVKRFPLNPRTAEIEFFSFEFQRLCLGRERAMFTDLVGE